MYPKADECPALPYEAMDSHTLLYDLIYNPDETLFMQKGAKYGATVKNGLEMLLLQALKVGIFGIVKTNIINFL